MSKLFILGLLIPLLSLTSCGDEENETPGVTFVMQEKAFILPGNGNSCAATHSTGDEILFDDVPEYRVALSNIRVTWSRTAQDFNVVYFKIQIKHPAIGEYTTTIDGLELDLLLGTSNGNAGSATLVGDAVTSVTMDTSSTSFLNPALGNKFPCSLTFGSIPIIEDSGFFTANATITLVAIARGNGKAAGELAEGEVPLSAFDEEAIKIEKTVKLEFDF